MKAGLTTLLCALLLGAASYLTITWHQTRAQPAQWLGQQLGLKGEALDAFTTAHEGYASFCAEMCLRIHEADTQLAALIRQSSSVTPEIEAAMAHSESLRAQCRLGMLEHFYTAAALLPEDRRDDYLRWVIPLITSTNAMPDPNHLPR